MARNNGICRRAGGGWPVIVHHLDLAGCQFFNQTPENMPPTSRATRGPNSFPIAPVLLPWIYAKRSPAMIRRCRAGIIVLSHVW